MKKLNKKTKKNLKIYGSIIALILIVAVLYITLNSGGLENEETAYFYDKDIGTVKVTYGVQKTNILFKPFEQAVTFSPTTALVGDVVTLKDSYKVPSGQCIGYFLINIVSPVTSEKKVASQCGKNAAGDIWVAGDTISSENTWTVNAAGEWSAKSAYFLSDCTAPQCSNVAPIIQTSVNSVEVSNPPTSCTDTQTSNWMPDHTINGGKIEKQTITTHTNPPTCTSNTITNYRTICDNNYQIKGTLGNEGPADGELECELINSNTTCTSTSCQIDKICNTNTGQCEAPECNGNLNSTCADGTIITTKYCNIATGLWSSQNGTSCPSNSTGNNTNGTTVTTVSKDCFKILTNSTAEPDYDYCNKEVKQVSNSTSECPSGYYASKTLCEEKITKEESGIGLVGWILIISSIGAVGVVIFIIVMRFRK